MIDLRDQQFSRAIDVTKPLTPSRLHPAHDLGHTVGERIHVAIRFIQGELLAILVGRDGGIHMLADSDWNIERLREHHAAAAAYRVTRHAGRVEVEARTAGQSCMLRREEPVRCCVRPSPRFIC